jgi:hypothetical protein
MPNGSNMIRCKWRFLLLISFLVISFSTGCNKHNPSTDVSSGTTQSVPEAKVERPEAKAERPETKAERPETKAEQRWPLYEVPTEGFALELPPDWRKFNMNPATFDVELQKAIKQNPEFEPLLSGLRHQLASGIKFFGFDVSSAKTGFATNVNVLPILVPPGGTLDMAIPVVLKELASVPSITKPISHERVKSATGECERFRYKFDMKSPKGQNNTLAITQFIFIKDGAGFTVTLTTLSDREAQCTPTFEKIGLSFRFINKATLD